MRLVRGIVVLLFMLLPMPDRNARIAVSRRAAGALEPPAASLADVTCVTFELTAVLRTAVPAVRSGPEPGFRPRCGILAVDGSLRMGVTVFGFVVSEVAGAAAAVVAAPAPGRIARGTSTGIAFARVCLMGLHEETNFPPGILEDVMTISGPPRWWFLLTAVPIVLILGYLFYIKRYFVASRRKPSPAH